MASEMKDNFNYNVSAVVKCDNCGADTIFDPDIQALHCPYCDTIRDIQKRVPAMRDYFKECGSGDVRHDGDTYKCPNCGADVKLAPFATAVECPYCSATTMIDVKDLKGLKPDSILPFTISRASAVSAGLKWIKRKLYAPYKLKKSFSPNNYQGVYVPSFAFTSSTISSYSGRFGERRTRVVGTGNNRRTETYIYWYNVSGRKDRFFQDIPVEASIQIEQKELSKIIPYDINNAVAYNKEYVAGFDAERYDTSLKDSFFTAKSQMEATIRSEIISSYKADVVDNLTVNTTYIDTLFRYTLLPLWVCAYNYRKKSYRFLINGRTGKSTGKWPVSIVKVGITVLAVLAAIGVLVWAVLTGQI